MTTSLWCASTQVRPASTASKYPADLKSRFLEGLTGPELKSVMAASTQRPQLTRSQALDVAAAQRAIEAEDDLMSRRLVDSYERGRAAVRCRNQEIL